MARPKNKLDLLEEAQKTYEKLEDLMGGMEDKVQQASFSFDDRDQSLKDLLVHLHEWHKMFLNWYSVGMAGARPIMPRPGYTWRTTKEMNYMIRDLYQATDLAASKELLRGSHQDLMLIIQNHSDQELFTKEFYGWTGSTSLASYLISATSSHYDWASKKIKKHIKTYKI